MLKYSLLKDKIIAYIRQERLASGDRIPGVRELMAKYAVSKNTVSHALSLLAHEHLIEQRHGSGIYVKMLRGHKPLTIGLILPEANNPFLNHFLHLLAMAKERYAVNIITKISAYDPAREREAAAELIAAGARGLLLMPEPRGVNSRHFAAIAKRGIGVVNVIRRFDTGDIPYVVPDNRAVGRLAAQRLIKAGCRHLVYIGNCRMKRVDERCQGFLEMVAQAGISMSQRRIVFTEVENTVEAGRRSFEAARARVKAIDGVMAFHDIYAAGVLRYCNFNGISVPGDLRLIGCDNLEVAEYITPGLTSIECGVKQIATWSLALIREWIAGRVPKESRLVLKPRLVVRASG